MTCVYEIGVRKGVAQEWVDYPGTSIRPN
jgi:hypothetical protein